MGRVALETSAIKSPKSQTLPSYIRVVHIDTKLGGYSHDLRIESVADAVIAIAANSRCLGVLLSVPCDTWSAIRFNKDSDSPEPLRDCDFPDGIPDADGVLPTAAEAANTVADVACAAATACAEHGGRVVAAQYHVGLALALPSPGVNATRRFGRTNPYALCVARSPSLLHFSINA